MLSLGKPAGGRGCGRQTSQCRLPCERTHLRPRQSIKFHPKDWLHLPPTRSRFRTPAWGEAFGRCRAASRSTETPSRLRCQPGARRLPRCVLPPPCLPHPTLLWQGWGCPLLLSWPLPCLPVSRRRVRDRQMGAGSALTRFCGPESRSQICPRRFPRRERPRRAPFPRGTRRHRGRSSPVRGQRQHTAGGRGSLSESGSPRSSLAPGLFLANFR